MTLPVRLSVQCTDAGRKSDPLALARPELQAPLERPHLDSLQLRHLGPRLARRRVGEAVPEHPRVERRVGHRPQLDVPTLRTFRNGWPYSALSAVKRLEYLRGFFRFCKDSGWIDANAAMALKPPKVAHRPTLPFDDEEVERILKATDDLADWGSFGPKARAMVLLLRYSGLRMQDAACLERRRLNDNRLFLYTQKTGTPVYCPLPPETITALDAVHNSNIEYVFWDGRSERETTVKSWNRVFRKIFKTADPPIAGGHPPRFRDTFAVSLLLKGVELSHVSILLGHTSIKVTERHYAPWVKARQEQLEAEVRRIWS